MDIKRKIINVLTSNPKLVTFGIALAITFIVGTAVGIIIYPQHAFAVKPVEG